MAEVPPSITIRLNEDELKAQVTSAVAEALEEVSWKFRAAADALNPNFQVEERRWWEEEIAHRVEEKLEEAEK